MKILVLDIETAPNLAHVWGMWRQDIRPDALRVPGRMICFAAKWLGSKTVLFYSEHHDGREEMLTKAWELLNEADAVIHYNGKGFDIPWIQAELAKAGFGPPSPHKDIDLLKVVKGKFRLPFNSLAYVTRWLELETKLAHTGHKMWVDILEGTPEERARAWNLMRRYNRRDVRITERLYLRILPWIPNHPHVGAFVDTTNPVCPRCGSSHLQRRGSQLVQALVYPRFQCQTCGGWARAAGREKNTEGRPL